jgi:glycine oxidase
LDVGWPASRHFPLPTSHFPLPTLNNVIFVGAGVIGLSIAWRLTREGVGVTLFDKGEAGRQASWQAGGMLAADAEMGFEEPDLYRFARASMERWPSFVRELESDSGLPVDFRTEGTLRVADDADSEARLRRVYEFQKSEGVDLRWISGREAREIEPFLAPRVSAAIETRHDVQVDNQKLILALIEAIRKRGGTIVENTAIQRIEPDGSTPRVVDSEGRETEGDLVVLSAGAWSRQIEGLPDDVRPPVRPVKGQMVELKMVRPFSIEKVIRGPHGYIVPKASGRLLIGATSEEMGFDTDVTAGGIYKLLEGAWEILPGIYDLPITATWAGLRPASRDHEPILGVSAAPGVFIATGHYRHGIMLAPQTAFVASELILGRETSPWPGPFSPARFTKGESA